MRLTTISAVVTLLLFMTILMTNSCRRKPTTPPLTCPNNEVWDGSNCVCNASSYRVDDKCVNVGMDMSGVLSVFKVIGSNCGDWRDSLLIGSIPKLGSNQVPIDHGFTGAGCFGQFTYYKELPTKDTFQIAYAYMDYHYTRPNQGFAVKGSINKNKDTICTKIYNASDFAEPYKLYDFCEKVFVKIK
jgi:hypothetical protein